MALIRVVAGTKQVSGYNRAVQFGDAHFTTLKITQHKVEHWPLHLERLLVANSKLAFPAFCPQQLTAEITDIAEQYANATVKILMTRGESQRGYAVPDSILSLCYIYIVPAAHPPSELAPAELVTLKTRLSVQPLLAGLKHCNRLEQVLIKQELADLDVTDGLVFNYSGHLIETSMANIFVFLNGRWCTPDLTGSGVAGVIRSHILARHSIDVCNISEADVGKIEAAVLTNALIGVRPVKSIDDRLLSVAKSQAFRELVYG
ncbi:aminodeoxychorismate lyase [Gayadomonas joobiniege]|uniref:aminodeoxychorismate lyase n=1 Tax=Gayadomonas joobiniege TaxID=1234606 RepID=UPI00037DF151|nr:aminodeoxychorismate lyase [Gayadomonas joobiniege]